MPLRENRCPHVDRVANDTLYGVSPPFDVRFDTFNHHARRQPPLGIRRVPLTPRDAASRGRAGVGLDLKPPTHALDPNTRR